MEDLNRFVRLRNAHLVQQAQGGYEAFSRNTNLVELLQICHKLSLLLTVVEPPSSNSSEASEDPEPQIVPYPQYIRVWWELPGWQEMEWTFLNQHATVPDLYVFPSNFQYSLIEQSIQPIRCARDVHSFRYQTAYRFLRIIWGQIVRDHVMIACILNTIFDLTGSGSIIKSTLEFELQAGSDYCCVCLAAGRHKLPLFFVDYLAPQDFSVAGIKQGIKDFILDIDTAPYGRIEDSLLAAMTRVFARMVSTGVTAGVIDTGEALVFLQIHRDHPDILCVHKYIPREEIGNDCEGKVYQTVVAQYLSFALISLNEKAPTQEWYASARKLRTCKLSPHGVESIFQPDPVIIFPDKIDTRLGISSTEDEVNDSQYCTQKCLLGLCSGGELDKTCPNVKKHGDKYHKIGPMQLIHLIFRQLTREVRPYAFRPIHLHGQHHHYLKGVVEDYGYTFLVKAVEQGHEEELVREYMVYQNLGPAQGFIIPVCIGWLDLKTWLNEGHIYYGKKFEKMMLLSCSGGSAVDVIDEDSIAYFKDRRDVLKRDLAAIGLHGPNLSWCNLVWNEDEESLVWINFVEDPPQ